MVWFIQATSYRLLSLVTLMFVKTLFLSIKYTCYAANWLKLATLGVLIYAQRTPPLNGKTLATDRRGIFTQIKSITVKLLWENQCCEHSWGSSPFPEPSYWHDFSLARMGFSCCHHFAGTPQQLQRFNTCHISVVLRVILSTFPPRGFAQRLERETKPFPLQVNVLHV